MFLLDGDVVTSASDLTVASHCEFAFARGLDVKLGHAERLPDVADALLDRTARLGDAHEERVLDGYRSRFGDVAEIARPDRLTRESLAEAVADTHRAFDRGADAVFQATFFDGAFVGFADFIVREPDGAYRVQDSKLARSARVTALLQLVAYVEQLRAVGIRTSDTVDLLLGDGTVSSHLVDDVLPVYRRRRARLLRIVEERRADARAVAWGDPRYSVCGHCPTCEHEIATSRDVLLVAGLQVTQRTDLAAVGIRSIDELAASEGQVPGIGDSTLAGLRAQARLQVGRREPGSPPPYEVQDASALAVLPAPDAGDVFFDFEGDPLHTEGEGTTWGLDYLFGLVEVDGTFRAWWAHDFREEAVALRGFLDYLAERRVRHPGLHVYHYASYERTHLLSLAARHGIGEHEIDDLLREHALVDLYPVVRQALRVGSPSYSIKKLEPLYMGSDLRDADGVTTAGDSIVQYAEAVALRDRGETDAAARVLAEIEEYNAYDCRSTLALRDWLLELAGAHGVRPGLLEPEAIERDDTGPSPLALRLLELAGDPVGRTGRDRTPDETAWSFAAAMLDYHRREDKTFWWGHFSRLLAPIDEWADQRDVLLIEHAEVERGWHREGRQKKDRRHLRLRGTWGPGSRVRASATQKPYLVYAAPGPFSVPNADPGARPARTVTVDEIDDDGSVLVVEISDDRWDALPIALAPPAPPPTGNQHAALERWAESVAEAAPAWPADPMSDILRRTPSRTRSGALAPVAHELADEPNVVGAVVASLADLDRSYLAVQGPPGTGKTWLGAHVIARLVREHGWRVGVVAQSHAVVEHLLEAIVTTGGLDGALVGKEVAQHSDPAVYTVAGKDRLSRFTAAQPAGYVVGGTAWDLTNPKRVAPGSLDLVVIDEAGQFSLTDTAAVATAGRSLLLLGDPQQLPQVSQGTHPEPVDQSALGWISSGHDVLPADLGYFLARTRRMHPALTAPVSRLSYEGALHAHPCTSDRELDGIEPGLHVVAVEHSGDTIESVAEADEVVRLARDAIGRRWRDGTVERQTTERDVIVVAPYNAQVELIRSRLAAAGIESVRVGTVDRFQGQEAVVAIESLAASSAADAPRGMDFLLMRNRLTVALSRGQWASYLVHSPALGDGLPHTPAGVAELSAFLTLVDG